MAQPTRTSGYVVRMPARPQPWAQQFMSEHPDGCRWGYAIFLDPSVDEEQMESCMCRMDLLLHDAQNAVFGRDHWGSPWEFKGEVLDWPDDDDDEGDEETNDGVGEESRKVPAEAADDNDESQSESVVDDDQKRDDEDDEDDADIETVRELPKLRKHFKWVRDRAKRRKAYDALDDRSGIPNGHLRNVFLVIDQDVVDSMTNTSPFADGCWVWAIDPDYTGDVASMSKNGLTDEYYGYMRVRVQQLANRFWEIRSYREDVSMPMLWEAAKQSHNYAFVSTDPEEARRVSSSMDLGSAVRAQAS